MPDQEESVFYNGPEFVVIYPQVLAVGLTPATLGVFVFLVHRCRRGYVMTREQIATDMSCSVHLARQALSELESKGLTRTVAHRDHHGRTRKTKELLALPYSETLASEPRASVLRRWSGENHPSSSN